MKTKTITSISVEDVKALIRKHLGVPDSADVRFLILVEEKGTQWDPCPVCKVTDVEVTTHRDTP